MAAARFLLGGRVQGVCFRASMREQATRLGVHGHARNLHDGRVEVVAYGTADALDTLAQWLAHGPTGARVDTLERLALADDDTAAGFSIR